MKHFGRGNLKSPARSDASTTSVGPPRGPSRGPWCRGERKYLYRPGILLKIFCLSSDRRRSCFLFLPADRLLLFRDGATRGGREKLLPNRSLTRRAAKGCAVDRPVGFRCSDAIAGACMRAASRGGDGGCHWAGGGGWRCCRSGPGEEGRGGLRFDSRPKWRGRVMRAKVLACLPSHLEVSMYLGIM